jgi:hypothetical protein
MPLSVELRHSGEFGFGEIGEKEKTKAKVFLF